MRIRGFILFALVVCTIIFGNGSIVQLLLRKGASLNRIDRSKTTPLMLAQQRGMIIIIYLLIYYHDLLFLLLY